MAESVYFRRLRFWLSARSRRFAPGQNEGCFMRSRLGVKRSFDLSDWLPGLWARAPKQMPGEVGAAVAGFRQRRDTLA